MKKILPISLLTVVCLGCQNKSSPTPQSAPVIEPKDSLFDKKVRCIELKPILEKSSDPITQIDEIFYSEKLDTCVVTKTTRLKDATVFAIYDALSNTRLFIDRNINNKPFTEFMPRVDELKAPVRK